jgi:class 3 adenylate cyclase
VVARNVGLPGKIIEYSMTGDTFNQAARLQGTAKYYRAELLIGESTYLLTYGTFRYRELDRTAL